MSNLLPKYTPKGKRLYHRKESLTPEQRLVSEFFDRFRDTGIVASEDTGQLYHYYNDFICQALPENTTEGTLYRAMAYAKDKFMGKEWNLVTPTYYNSAKRAVDEIHRYIDAIRRS
jgi:hypothetical protein